MTHLPGGEPPVGLDHGGPIPGGLVAEMAEGLPEGGIGVAAPSGTDTAVPLLAQHSCCIQLPRPQRRHRC